MDRLARAAAVRGGVRPGRARVLQAAPLPAGEPRSQQRPRLQRIRVLAFRDDAAAAAARAAEGTAGTGMTAGRVKVFFLIPSLVQGGAERQILELIGRLPD